MQMHWMQERKAGAVGKAGAIISTAKQSSTPT